MPTKTFAITPDQFAQFRAKAEAQGVTVPPGNDGTVTTHGFVIDFSYDFSYDGTANLTLRVTGLPWFAFGNYDIVWNFLAPYLP